MYWISSQTAGPKRTYLLEMRDDAALPWGVPNIPPPSNSCSSRVWSRGVWQLQGKAGLAMTRVMSEWQCLQGVVVSSKSFPHMLSYKMQKRCSKEVTSEVGNLSWVSLFKNSSQIGHVGSVSIPHPLSIPYASHITVGC